MDHMPLIALILQSIPESFAFLLFALAITHFKFKWRQLIFASILIAFTTYIIRSLLIQYGINITLEIPLIFLIIKFVFKISFKRAVLISLFGLTALGLAEGAVTPILLSITGISLQQALNSSILRIIVPMPQIIGLLVLGFYLYRKNIYIFNEDFLK